MLQSKVQIVRVVVSDLVLEIMSLGVDKFSIKRMNSLVKRAALNQTVLRRPTARWLARRW